MKTEKKCCYHDPDEECACECHESINWEERYNKAVEYFKTAKFVAIDSLPRTRANGRVHNYKVTPDVAE